MKKILVISEYFAPQNTIAAVRLTKIVKYLNKDNEFNIDVICRENFLGTKDSILEKDIENKATIIVLNKNRILKKLRSKFAKIKINKNTVKQKQDIFTKHYKRSLKNKYLLNLSWYIYNFESLVFKNKAIKYLKKTNINSYTHIISSFGPISCHLIAKFIKSKNNHVFWLADFRDPVLNDSTPRLFYKWSINYASRVCKSANAISAVSEGCLNALFLENFNNKYVITNGYDKEDLGQLANISYLKNKEMTFVYTGALYSGKSDLFSFFIALNELIEENLIDPLKIKVIYAGSSSADFIKQISKFPDLIYEIKDMLPRDEALVLQRNADFLLLASWNNKNETGILTGKFFEYLMMRKPIIATITGDLPNSELFNLITENSLGVCFEEANRDKTHKELKKYLYEQYLIFIKTGSVIYSANQEFVESYDYQRIVSEIKKIISL